MMLIGRLRPHRETKYRNKAGAPRAHEKYRGSFGPASSLIHTGGRSMLEQLPTELLQQIFIYSANLDLPFCSRQLLAALSSEHLKFELTLQILVYQTYTMSRRCRSSLLSRRFFDWNFVLKYARFAHARVPASLTDSDDDDDGSNSEVSSSGASDDDSSSDEDAEAEDQANDGASSAAVTTGSTATMKTSFSVAASLDDFDEARLPSLVDEDVRQTWSKCYDRDNVDLQTAFDTRDQLEKLPGSRGFAEKLYLPSKLLHGPWDDDRLQLLRYLLALGCSMVFEPSAETTLELGKLEAIEANDEEVSWHLIGRISPGDHKPEFTLEMLRAAVTQNAISTVYVIIAQHGQTVDRLDPQVWNLVDAHAKWSKREKRMIQDWLRNDTYAQRMPDKKYLPHLRLIKNEQQAAVKTPEKEYS